MPKKRHHGLTCPAAGSGSYAQGRGASSGAEPQLGGQVNGRVQGVRGAGHSQGNNRNCGRMAGPGRARVPGGPSEPAPGVAETHPWTAGRARRGAELRLRSGSVRLRSVPRDHRDRPRLPSRGAGSHPAQARRSCQDGSPRRADAGAPAPGRRTHAGVGAGSGPGSGARSDPSTRGHEGGRTQGPTASGGLLLRHGRVYGGKARWTQAPRDRHVARHRQQYGERLREAGGRGRLHMAIAGGPGRRRAGGGAVPTPATVACSPARAELGTRAPGAATPHGGDAAAVCCGWSTSRPTRTATGTAGSASATGRGGDGSTWSCGRCTGRARRRSWTTRARSSRSWTGRPARCRAPWSSSVSSAPRTTPSWT